jgi:hypothetical protein
MRVGIAAAATRPRRAPAAVDGAAGVAVAEMSARQRRLDKIRALIARPGSTAEKAAAEAALERMLNRSPKPQRRETAAARRRREEAQRRREEADRHFGARSWAARQAEIRRQTGRDTPRNPKSWGGP